MLAYVVDVLIRIYFLVVQDLEQGICCLFFDLENWSVVTFKMLQHQKRKKCENLYIAVFFLPLSFCRVNR